MYRLIPLLLMPLAIIACGSRQSAGRGPTRAAADGPAAGEAASLPEDAPPAADGGGKSGLSDAQWRERLTPEQYRILREKGTERAFSGAYWDTTTAGVYGCAGCGQPLFVSDAKFESGCGWPSFFEPLAEGLIDEHVDTTLGMVRTELTCSRCGGHLGHVFDDGPEPTGLRYCINSVSIDLKPSDPPGGGAE